MKKKLIKILLIFVISISFTNSTFASNLNFADDRGILLYEEKSDFVLYEQNMEKKIYPASTTKIMTALLVLENLSVKDVITVGNEITLISKDSSKADLKDGEKLTVEELLHGLLVVSGNDVAYTLARSVGGKVGGKTEASEAISYFVDMMNKRAKELGANNTHFVNPHGLHHANHYSTPRDMLIITKELLKHEQVRKIVNIPVYTTRTNFATHKWASTNVFLHKTWDEIPYVNTKGTNQYYTLEVRGIKTGFTDQAGRCIIFSAQKDGLDLIGLIYHSTYEQIWQEGIDLMNYATENYEYIDLVKNNDEVDNLHVSNSSKDLVNNISVITKEHIPLLVKSENKENINKTKIIEYDEKILQINEDKTVKLKKDIKSDQIIGRITYKVQDEVIESNLYSAHSVEKKNFLSYLFQWQILLLTVALLLLFVMVGKVKKNAKRKK